MRKTGEGDGHAWDVGEAETSMGFGEKRCQSNNQSPMTEKNRFTA